MLETFGDKTAAKRLAMQAGVPTIPGTEHGSPIRPRSKRRRSEIGYPVDHQGELRRRRARHARRAAAERTRRQAGRGPARSRRGVRAARSVPRALHRRAPSTSKCRSSATRTATWCTCGSATARCSGGIRRSSRSRPASTCRSELRAADLRSGRRGCARSVELSQRRHGRVSARRRSQRVLLHRGQPAHPGRAHGHRGGHRHRPRQEPDPRRRRATSCTSRR